MNTNSLSAIARKVFPDDIPPRLLLIFFALAFQTVGVAITWFAWNTDNTHNLFLVSISFSAWLLWFLLVFLMAVPNSDNLLRAHIGKLRRGAMLIAALLILASIGEVVAIQLVNAGAVSERTSPDEVTEVFSYGDDTAAIHQAAEHLLNGDNPYTSFDIFAALDRLDLPVTRVTPLQQGAFSDVFPLPTDEQMLEVGERIKASAEAAPQEFLTKLVYPAGSFMFVAPFVGMGMGDITFFYLLCALVMGAVIFWKCPRQWRPLVIIVFIINLMLWNDVAGGRTDILYVLLVLLGWMWRRKLLLSAVIMGLAAATKQMALVFVLFYLVLQLREVGWKQSLRLVGVIAGTFLVINFPFIVNAPGTWLDGVLAESLEPYFPRGVGLSTFSIAGILPADKGLYLILTIASLIPAIIWYYFKCLKYPHTGLVLAVLPFFFNWHSDARYLYFAPLLIFGAVAIEASMDRSTGEKSQIRNAVH